MEFLKLATWQERGQSGCTFIKSKSCSLRTSFMNASMIITYICVSTEYSDETKTTGSFFKQGFILQMQLTSEQMKNDKC